MTREVDREAGLIPREEKIPSVFNKGAAQILADG